MRVVLKAVQDSRFSKSAKFTAAHRLLRGSGFDHVVHANNLFDKKFKIFFVRNGKSHARLGIIVGKKTISSAVVRNSVKRIIREAFRQHGIKQCKLDIVVLLRYAELQKALAGNLNTLFSQVEQRCAEF